MKSSLFLKPVIVLACLAAAPMTMLAQGPKRGSVDVAVGGGYAYLNTSDDGTNDGKKHHATLDTSISYNVLKAVSVGFEYTFTPLDNETINGINFTEHLHNYGAVARVALLPNRFLVPYVLVAGGGLQLKDQATQGNVTGSIKQSGGYFGAGGGANVYLGHGFGVRPEFRYQRQTLSDTTIDGIAVKGSGKNEAFLTGSIFYQFGGRGK
jgi:hypothetical protein